MSRICVSCETGRNKQLNKKSEEPLTPHRPISFFSDTSFLSTLAKKTASIHASFHITISFLLQGAAHADDVSIIVVKKDH